MKKRSICRSIILFLVLLMTVTLLPITIEAAGNTVRDKGVPISEGDIKYFELDTTIIERSPNLKDHSACIIPEEGKSNGNCTPTDRETFTVTYPKALKYFGHDLTVVVEAQFLGKNGFQDLGAERSYIRTRDAYGETMLWLDAVGTDYSITVSFYDEEGQPFDFSGALLFQDPDQANYLISDLSSDSTVYYVDTDDERDLGLSLADHYDIIDGLGIIRNATGTSEPIKDEEGKWIPDASWVGFNSGKFGILLEDRSTFTFVVNGKVDTIWLPEFFMVDVPYKVEFYYQEKGGAYPTTPNETDTRWADSGETVRVTEKDLVPTLDGYVIDDSSEYTTEYEKVVQEDGTTVLRVYFKLREYTVTYKPGDHGTFEEKSTTGLFYGDPTPASPETTGEPGYKFIGWDIEVEDTVTHDAVYVAQWEPLPVDYKVEFYYERDGQYSNEPDSSDIRQEKTGETVNVTDTDKSPEKDGYVLDEETELKLYSDTVAGDGTTVLKVYFKQQFTVIYKDGVDGKVFVDETNKNIDYGENTPAFKGKTDREGYDFQGWSPAIVDTVTHDAVYVAQWKPWTYSIEYDANGGSGEMNTQVFTLFDRPKSSKENQFTRDGYRFVGFYVKYKNGDEVVFNGTRDFTSELENQLGKYGVVKLIAQWEKLPDPGTKYITPKTGVE